MRDQSDLLVKRASTEVEQLQPARERFAPDRFLDRIESGRSEIIFEKKATIFSQGDACDAIFFIKHGRVKLTVVSATGKEATIGIIGEGYFFGEDCLAGQTVRIGSANALTLCKLIRIQKAPMLSALHSQQQFSDMFVEYLLARNIRYQEDLIDQLFNSSEKRLARVLLLFAGFGQNGIAAKTKIPKIDQATLAEMIGTTRSRVSFFMNKFRRLGFIDYNGEILVHSSLLNVVLHD